MLVFEECSYHNYFLPEAETGAFPEDPYDAFTWFMPAMNEWLTEIFQTWLNKINEQDEPSESTQKLPTLDELVGKYEK